MLLGTILTVLTIQLTGRLFGVPDVAAVMNTVTDQTSIAEMNLIRIFQFFSQVCTFVLPALFFVHLCYPQAAWNYFRLHPIRQPTHLLAGIVLLVAIYPLVQYIYTANKALPLPQWLKDMGGSNDAMIQALMRMDSVGILLFNLVVLALIPAFAEELLFRGVLQRVVARSTRSTTLGIWLSAATFSAMHMQFDGFFPRLFLGALLGYLLAMTDCLWIPIIAHFFNNALQIVLIYVVGIEIDDSTAQVPILLTVGSVVLSILLFGWLRLNTTEPAQSYKERVLSDE